MNNDLKTKNLVKTKNKQFPQPTKLNLEQLGAISGAPAGDGCPWCIYSA